MDSKSLDFGIIRHRTLGYTRSVRDGVTGNLYVLWSPLQSKLDNIFRLEWFGGCIGFIRTVDVTSNSSSDEYYPELALDCYLWIPRNGHKIPVEYGGCRVQSRRCSRNSHTKNQPQQPHKKPFQCIPGRHHFPDNEWSQGSRRASCNHAVPLMWAATEKNRIRYVDSFETMFSLPPGMVSWLRMSKKTLFYSQDNLSSDWRRTGCVGNFHPSKGKRKKNRRRHPQGSRTSEKG